MNMFTSVRHVKNISSQKGSGVFKCLPFMTAITPGVDFLVKGTFILSFPALAAYAVGLVSERFGGTPITAWALISTGLIIVPILTALRISLTRLNYRWAAAALGAKMVPCAQGKWPGNADVLKTMQHNFTYGYPGVYTLNMSGFPPL